MASVPPPLKVNEGRPNIVDKLINGEVALIVNTPLGRESFYDEVSIRRTALERDVPCLTTLSAAAAAIEAIRARAAGAPLLGEEGRKSNAPPHPAGFAATPPR